MSVGAVGACGGGQGEESKGDGTLSAATGSSSRYFEPGERTVTPTLKGATLEGRSIDISDMHGDVVVVNLWGSWCAPCRKEAPDLVRLAEETTDLGVRFLGIDVRDNKAAAQAFERSYGIPYPSIFDPGGRAAAGFGRLAPRAVPTTYVLDRTGRVAALSIGPLSYRGFKPIIRDIAAENR